MCFYMLENYPLMLKLKHQREENLSQHCEVAMCQHELRIPFAKGKLGIAGSMQINWPEIS